MREEWAREFSALARAYWTEERTADLTRGKSLALLPGEASVLLRALGLLHRDASLPPAERRKYFQINHMLAVLGPSLRELAQKHALLRFVDAGCGRSYFTLLLAWHVKHNLAREVEVIGVDRRPELIEECRRRTELAELGDLVRYECASLEDFSAKNVHGVVALHACDTATDDAILLGVQHHAELIACAPCCQAELAKKWSALEDQPGAFSSIWKTPHLRREIAATLTDAMRALLLRSVGYEVWPIEFVPSEHTPKNTMLRAMRRGAGNDAARAEYDALVASTGGAGLTLAEKISQVAS